VEAKSIDSDIAVSKLKQTENAKIFRDSKLFIVKEEISKIIENDTDDNYKKYKKRSSMKWNMILFSQAKIFS